MIQGMTNVATVRLTRLPTRMGRLLRWLGWAIAHRLADFAKTVGDEPSAEQVTGGYGSLHDLHDVDRRSRATRADELNISLQCPWALRVESEVGGGPSAASYVALELVIASFGQW